MATSVSTVEHNVHTCSVPVAATTGYCRQGDLGHSSCRFRCQKYDVRALVGLCSLEALGEGASSCRGLPSSKHHLPVSLCASNLPLLSLTRRPIFGFSAHHTLHIRTCKDPFPSKVMFTGSG